MVRKQQMEALRLQWASTVKQWENLESEWNDLARAHFAVLHWNPMERTLPSALRDLENLMNTLEQAEHQVAAGGLHSRRRGL